MRLRPDYAVWVEKEWGAVVDIRDVVLRLDYWDHSVEFWWHGDSAYIDFRSAGMPEVSSRWKAKLEAAACILRWDASFKPVRNLGFDVEIKCEDEAQAVRLAHSLRHVWRDVIHSSRFAK